MTDQQFCSTCGLKLIEQAELPTAEQWAAAARPAADYHSSTLTDEHEPPRRPALLGLYLSLVVPGSGHIYLDRRDGEGVKIGLLLGGTLVALVLACLSGTFPLGVLIWGGLAAYAVYDLRRVGLHTGSPLVLLAGVGVRRSTILILAGGAALLASLVGWYWSEDVTHTELFSAWRALRGIDIYLTVVAVASVLFAVVSATRKAEHPGALESVGGALVSGAGGLAALVVLYRLFVLPYSPGAQEALEAFDLGTGRLPGILISLAAALAVLVGGASLWVAANPSAVASSSRS